MKNTDQVFCKFGFVWHFLISKFKLYTYSQKTTKLTLTGCHIGKQVVCLYLIGNANLLTSLLSYNSHIIKFIHLLIHLLLIYLQSYAAITAVHLRTFGTFHHPRPRAIPPVTLLHFSPASALLPTMTLSPSA